MSSHLPLIVPTHPPTSRLSPTLSRAAEEEQGSRFPAEVMGVLTQAICDVLGHYHRDVGDPRQMKGLLDLLQATEVARGRAAEVPATLERCIVASMEAAFADASRQLATNVTVGELGGEGSGGWECGWVGVTTGRRPATQCPLPASEVGRPAHLLACPHVEPSTLLVCLMPVQLSILAGSKCRPSSLLAATAHLYLAFHPPFAPPLLLSTSHQTRPPRRDAPCYWLQLRG